MKPPNERALFSLVIPTYNERNNLPPLIERLTGALEATARDYEIIIVDDDSPDETWRVATEMASANPRLRVIRRRGERGLATAVTAGWRDARGDILGVMDGDLQYQPEGLPELLKPVLQGRADIVVGSRYASGATVAGWSRLREMISRAAILIAKLFLPAALRNLRDPSAGCFVMRRKVIEDVKLCPIGYKILIEVLARGRYEHVVELPYPYEGRKEGKSKLGSRQVFEFLRHISRLARETGELARLAKFCAVGVFGVLVNLGVLWTLTELYLTYYLYSAAIAVEAAIANNFIWNEFWTFADKTRGTRTLRHRFGRFFKFNMICSGGALLNLGALWSLTHLLGIYYLISALVAVGAAMAWNYCLNSHITWLSQRHRVGHRSHDSALMSRRIA